MKIQFDPQQQYQLDAVNAVVDLFDGQPLGKPDYSVIFQTLDTELFAGQSRSELGVGNQLLIDRQKLLQNLQTVQERHDLDHTQSIQSWEWYDGKENQWSPHFSVEMETGRIIPSLSAGFCQPRTRASVEYVGGFAFSPADRRLAERSRVEREWHYARWFVDVRMDVDNSGRASELHARLPRAPRS